MEKINVANRFLSVKDLSEIIRLAPGTIKNLLSKNPTSLPPRRVVCGTRSVLFLSTDVDRWMRGLPVLQGVGFTRDDSNKILELYVSAVAPGEDALKLNQSATLPRKRGRPSKAMQLARSKEAAEAGVAAPRQPTIGKMGGKSVC